MMKIVIDDSIQGLDQTFMQQANCILLPVAQITSHTLKDADALLCRSTLKINAELLNNTKVKWVGSCVSGEDHVDHAYLASNDIHFYTAKGCNAQAVVDYVLMALEAACADGLIPAQYKIAIIGVGCIGSRLNEQLQDQGIQATLCDPLRKDVFFNHTPLEAISGMDVVTLHTPLTKTGDYPTQHFLDEAFFERQKPGCLIINAARAQLIAENHLEKRLSHQPFCLDVWHGEPEPDLKHIQQAYIATPHIAGHTEEAKIRGTVMVFNQVAKMAGWPYYEMPNRQAKKINYDLKSLSKHFKSALNVSEDIIQTFKQERLNAPKR